MTVIVAVSPHLDDAVFSAGGTLAQRAAAGDRVVIATVFTGSVANPSGFALACQLDKGLSADVDYMALRRAEDREACAILKAEFVHLPFLEASHRGYENAPALFGPRLPNDDVVIGVTTALDALMAELDPDLVLGPRCIGDHVDHHVVREAIGRSAPPRAMAVWDDWPYVLKRGSSDGVMAGTMLLTPFALSARLSACAAYASQIAFQFGSLTAMRQTMVDHPFETIR